MSELFLLLDQLLGLAWIFPTLHRNYVSIQRPQKPCLRKQLRAARRPSASLTIGRQSQLLGSHTKPHHHHFVLSASSSRLLASSIFFMCLTLPFASPC